MYENYSVTDFNRYIPYVANIMKELHLSTTIFNEFSSTYYDDKNDGFKLLFRQCKYNYVNNI